MKLQKIIKKLATHESQEKHFHQKQNCYPEGFFPAITRRKARRGRKKLISYNFELIIHTKKARQTIKLKQNQKFTNFAQGNIFQMKFSVYFLVTASNPQRF